MNFASNAGSPLTGQMHGPMHRLTDSVLLQAITSCRRGRRYRLQDKTPTAAAIHTSPASCNSC
jgi:hypothetical protein